MFLSRITVIVLSISFLSSCTIPVFKNQEEGNNSGYIDPQKTNSGINVNTLSGSTDRGITPIIETNPISLNNSIIKTPVVNNTLTINESEKDDCLKNFQSLIDQQNCTDNFYIKKALKLKDSSVCTMVVNPSSQDNCKDNILFQDISTKSDITLCKKLKNPDTVGNCLAIVGKQIQSQNNKNEGKITDLCVGIEDKNIKSACTQSTIFNEAVRLRDMAMCKTLTDTIKQGMCASLIKSILDNSNPIQ